MDIERATDDFVRRGADLFRQLRLEGESLSVLGLTTLRTQLLILNVEAARLQHVAMKKSNCSHSRAIDDFIDANGERTGFVCCLECKAIFKDPAAD